MRVSPVWIHLYSLPYENWDLEILQDIGNIGKICEGCVTNQTNKGILHFLASVFIWIYQMGYQRT